MSLLRSAKQKQLAISALVVVAIGYALLSLAVRFMSEGFGPYTQTWLRQVVGCILLVIIFRRDIRWKAIRSTPLRDWLTLLLMGTVGYSVGVLFVTLGVLHTTLVNVSVLSSTMTFFAAVYTFLILRKRTSPLMLLFLVMSFTGAAMVATKMFPPVISDFGRGELFVLLSAAAFAWYGVGRKLLTKHLNNSEISAVTMAIAAVCSLVIASFMHEGINPAAFLSPIVLVGLAIGAGFNIVAAKFENFAFQHVSVVSGTQILLLENAVAPVFGYALYSETIGIIEIIGALLIIGAVALSARYASE